MNALILDTAPRSFLNNFSSLPNCDLAIRKNNTTPNQFLYLPADCRIYWSLATFNDYSQLWHDSWNGIYGDTSLCVAGSQNVKTPPRHIAALSWDLNDSDDPSTSELIGSAISAAKYSLYELFEVLDTTGQTGSNSQVVFCDDGNCNPVPSKCGGQQCRPVTFPCTQDGSQKCTAGTGKCTGGVQTQVQKSVCEKTCQTGHGNGQCGSANCHATTTASSSNRAPAGKGKLKTPKSSVKVSNGFCEPSSNTGAVLCSLVEDDVELLDYLRTSK